MASTQRRDLIVGTFVLAGLLAIAYLSIAIGGISNPVAGHLQIYAAFDEVGGLSSRAPVVVGGVKVGTVERIELDPSFRALVTLRISSDLKLPDDTSASILTQGVLGDQYIALEPGGSATMLADQGEIQFTQSAVILERLIGKVVQNLGVDSE
jgi:phospholipid/cholesterol/gamma-HCH transport system substrate-binding protein